MGQRDEDFIDESSGSDSGSGSFEDESDSLSEDEEKSPMKKPKKGGSRPSSPALKQPKRLGEDVKIPAKTEPVLSTKKRKKGSVIEDSDDENERDEMKVESAPKKSKSVLSENDGNGVRPIKKAKASPLNNVSALEVHMPKSVVDSATGAAAAVSSSTSSSAASSSSSSKVDGNVDFSKGPDITTEKAAKILILKYLRHQNRPYGAIQIFENLHRRVMKSLVERALDSLVKQEDSPVLVKEYKTNKIYWPKQKGMATATASDLKDMDNKLHAKKQELECLEKRYSHLSKYLATLIQEPSDEYLNAVLAEKEDTVAAMQVKADRLASNKIDPKALATSVQKHNLYRSKWIERKNGVMDVVNNIAEGMEKKPKVVMADLGIETDADVNTTIPSALTVPK